MSTQNNLPIPATRLGMRTWAIPVILLGAAVGVWLLFHSLILFVLLMVAGLMLAGTLVFGVMLSRKALSDARQAPQLGSEYAELKRALSRAQYQEKTEKQGERASELFSAAIKKYQFVSRVLEGKFDPTELTFGRYQQACENVFKAVMDQLKRASDLLMSLGQLSDPTLGKDQEAKVESWLKAAEKALSELDQIGLALSEMQTQLSGGDLEAAMVQLKELAARAPTYALDYKTPKENSNG